MSTPATGGSCGVITRGLPRPCPRAPTARAARLRLGGLEGERKEVWDNARDTAGRSFFIFAGRFGAAGSAARFMAEKRREKRSKIDDEG